MYTAGGHYVSQYSMFCLAACDIIYSRWNVKWLTGTSSGSPNISVVYERKWLKIGLQAHFCMMFGHTKFQLSNIFAFRDIILLDDESVISGKLSDFPSYHSITLKVIMMES